MNKKGQTLVLFVLLLPILFIFIMLVLEVGLLLVDKNKVNNEIKYAIKYAYKTDRVDEDKIRKCLTDNLGDDIVIEIKLATSDIHIEVNKKHNFLFSNKTYTINGKYRGYKSDDTVYLERE